MQNVYERILRQSTGTALIVPADESPRCFIIPFIPAGLLKKLIVKQAGGTPVAFKVNLYNAHVVATEEPGVSSSLVPEDIDKDLCKIIPEQEQTTPGAAMSLFSEDGFAFRNTMGTHSDPRRELYLEIDPTTPSDDTTWEVAIAAIPAIVS